MSSVSKGKKFETQVAELYRLMGYNVKQNVGILGHQIDIVLTYTMPGGIETKTAVECKYISKGNLQKNKVMENVYALVDLKRSDKVQQLTIVTTNGFSKDVWDTARDKNIQLLTFHELQHQIVNFDHYLQRIVQDFETDELSTYYVDLIAQDNEKMPKRIGLADQCVIKWVNNKKNHLSILGEYGTGKTSFCRKLAHDLAIKCNNDPLNNRIPILINLRDYSKVMSVRQLITDLLINEYGLQGVNFSLFENMNKEGLFLLIFDGFDEMAQKVIFDVAYSNFCKIAELAAPKKSKVILTCRTEFFRTHEQEREILLDISKRKNFGIIYLREFDDEQIKEFLQKRVPLIEKRKKKDWEYYYQKVHDIFDLRDLAKRPVLLDLIVKYLPQLIKKGETINASTLYQTTIYEELKRRIRVGKTVIRRDDRIKLMKLLAVWMYNHDRLSVHYEDIPALLNLKMHFDLKTRRDIEYHLNDFLTYSFLNRDADGNYRFSHKSFVDFLVACKFVHDIEKDVKDDFIQKKITYEVIQFMKNFNINKKRLYEWIASTKGKSFSETQYMGGNAVSVLNELGENFTDKRVDFSETVLDYANFQGQNLKGLTFKNASMKYANLNNTTLVDTDFSFADLEGATFEEMNGIDSVQWSPDGKYLISGDTGGIVRVWSTRDFKELTAFKEHTKGVWEVVYSPCGNYVASGSRDKTVKVWDTKTFKPVATLKGHVGEVYCAAYSPCGNYVASGSRDKTVKVWDMKTFKSVATLEGHTKEVCGVVYLNGNYLASGSCDNTIKIWDMKTFKSVATLKGHSHYIQGVAYSPCGTYVASGSWDNTVKIWDMKTFKPVTTLRGHKDAVFDVAFSPCGDYVASGSGDKTVKVWDMKTFKPVATFRGHTREIWDIAFSPCGKYVASGSWDKTIKIWDTNPESKTFRRCLHTIKQQIDCTGMKIRDARGLDEKKMKFLKKQGAIDMA